MTVEEIKKTIKVAEQSCVYEMLDFCGGGKVNVLVMDVYPKRNVKKALKELDIKKYCLKDDAITYTIYV